MSAGPLPRPDDAMPVTECRHCGAKVKDPDADYCRKCDGRLYPDEEYEGYDPDDAPKKKKGNREAKKALIREVAWCQQKIIFMILANIGINAMVRSLPPDQRLIVGGVLFVVMGVVQLYLVYRLAKSVMPGAGGIVLTVLAALPCVSIIALLVLNGKATALLRENGVRVGIMGAKSGELP